MQLMERKSKRERNGDIRFSKTRVVLLFVHVFFLLLTLVALWQLLFPLLLFLPETVADSS